MEQLHFSHEHLLRLVQLQPDYKENSDNEDEDEDEDKDVCFVMEKLPHDVKCKMCKEGIYPFHLCYYSCNDCDYTLHTFCAQLPPIKQNHPLHPNHNLTLSVGNQFQDSGFSFTSTVDKEWVCDICKVPRKMFYNYHCSICKFNMDIICAALSDQKMNHPSHPHQLQRNVSSMKSRCNACGNEHNNGTFFHCTTCFGFTIHLDCALLPAKLLIQQYTDGSFCHRHLLTLAYSFPYIELRAKFFPHCRVCDKGFNTYEWHYRCNRCRYYVHVECATAKKYAGLGETSKKYKESQHPGLIHCPFPDESSNLLTWFMGGEHPQIIGEKDVLADSPLHPHRLFRVDKFSNAGFVSLHDPMRKVEVLCNGCVRPVTNVPLYKCFKDDCDFVLHDWCTKLPDKVLCHPDHQTHELVLLPKICTNLLGLFVCEICELPCNGFAYGCVLCEYYVDIHCAFIPMEITHEAHPNHLLLACRDFEERSCRACDTRVGFGKSELQLLKTSNARRGKRWAYNCPTCDFYLHLSCAFLLPKTINHRYDKHPLCLRYSPAENYSGDYFCEVCEDEFNPTPWFYHCSECAMSMHTACAPLKLQAEQSTYSIYEDSISEYCNLKFGGTFKIKYQCDPFTFAQGISEDGQRHPFTFAQGISEDGQCPSCKENLQFNIILKCSEWGYRYAIHIWCAYPNERYFARFKHSSLVALS